MRYKLPNGMTNVGVGGVNLVADADGYIDVPDLGWSEVHNRIQDTQWGLGLLPEPPTTEPPVTVKAGSKGKQDAAGGDGT